MRNNAWIVLPMHNDALCKPLRPNSEKLGMLFFFKVIADRYTLVRARKHRRLEVNEMRKINEHFGFPASATPSSISAVDLEEDFGALGVSECCNRIAAMIPRTGLLFTRSLSRSIIAASTHITGEHHGKWSTLPRAIYGGFAVAKVKLCSSEMAGSGILDL